MAELRVKSTGTLKLFENDNTSSVTIASPASLGGDRTVTLPDASVTLASGTMLATDGDGSSLTGLPDNTPNFGAKATSDQSSVGPGWTKVQFDTEYFDVGGGYDAANDKFVVPAGEGGKYYFTASAKINPGTTGGLIGCGMRLTVGGSASDGLEEMHFMNDNPSHAEGKNVNGILDLSAADEVEVYAYLNDSGAAAGTITGATSEIDTFFFGFKIAE